MKKTAASKASGVPRAIERVRHALGKARSCRVPAIDTRNTGRRRRDGDRANSTLN
eukprot:CAMPEP_0197415042 /NCGR_PEP_ID=MMETSP1170-20131217/1641_1 /TAXON_ID=54406 /ORGANISM="Sarcinochrysis sp, Strain CCMP770" /LENGTH=54 /DNA_ID=CAMNT_0042941803 /DNA_START=294 /DNA_END=458 /DNA_ORIENTATION=-